MKNLLVLLLVVVCSSAVVAQSGPLIIKGEGGKFYVLHIVEPKENWYSVGRLFNISPRDIAPFNNLTINKPLTIGEELKIPLLENNFSQDVQKAGDEALVPVYHIVQPREWISHVSTTYNKVPVEKLEKWNHIKKDQAKAGMQLIVGYLKVKSSQSALAGSGQSTQKIVQETEKEEVTDKSVTKTVIKPETPAQKPVISTRQEAINDNSTPKSSNINANFKHIDGGFFSSEFGGGSKNTSGQAGVFKSSSGWEDGKYYALMNNIPVGTIVKVTSTNGNKSIYAKVLGQLPDMKESSGLSIRISNAASTELGIGEGRFAVEINY